MCQVQWLSFLVVVFKVNYQERAQDNFQTGILGCIFKQLNFFLIDGRAPKVLDELPSIAIFYGKGAWPYRDYLKYNWQWRLSNCFVQIGNIIGVLSDIIPIHRYNFSVSLDMLGLIYLSDFWRGSEPCRLRIFSIFHNFAYIIDICFSDNELSTTVFYRNCKWGLAKDFKFVRYEVWQNHSCIHLRPFQFTLGRI